MDSASEAVYRNGRMELNNSSGGEGDKKKIRYSSSDQMINHVKSEAGFPMEGFYNIVFPITCFVQKQVLVLVVSINPLCD